MKIQKLETPHPLWSIRCRHQTYKSYDHARRAFYRWIVKNDYFEPMRRATEFERRNFGVSYIRYPLNMGSIYTRGYPLFQASNSWARRCWENIFTLKREEILAEHWRWRDQRRDAARRVEALKNRRSRKFFQTLAAPGLIAAHEVAH